MSPLASPPWAGGPASRGRAGADPGLRVSDAERAEVADRLSRHYGDGRLDQNEFEERLDRAMHAKTRADFGGLFADLPDAELTGPPPRPGSPRELTGAPAGPPPAPPWHRRHRVLFFALVILIAATVGQAMARFFVPWLVIALIAFCAVRLTGRCRRR